jgi:Protein of unknown function with PCYCGC motif
MRPRPRLRSIETSNHDVTRRQFVAAPLLLMLSASVERLQRRVPLAHRTEHPDPRPGITAEHVLPADHFKDPEVRRNYDMAREIPEVLDGLYCHCDCTKSMHHRSLLSCFESEQPSGCGTCQHEMRLAYKLHSEGKTLDDIRRAVDEKFG